MNNRYRLIKCPISVIQFTDIGKPQYFAYVCLYLQKINATSEVQIADIAIAETHVTRIRSDTKTLIRRYNVTIYLYIIDFT